LPNPDFTFVQPTCGTNGSITIATVADSYSFDGGNTWTTNPTLSGLTSGYYNIVIKNATGCKSFAISIYINPFYLPNPNVKVIQPSCGNGGSIIINTPADQYSFDEGATWTTNPILLNPAASSYNIVIKNTTGCKSQSQYYYINKYYLPTPNVTSIQPTCSSPSGTIIINTTADQYSFDNGTTWTTNPIKKNLAGGSYNIVIKNTLGCISYGSYSYINSPPTIPPAPAVQIVQPSSCGATDGSITISTTALSYSFNDGNSWTTNPTKINVGAGTYIIKIKTNSYSCESSTTVVNLSSGTTIDAPAYTSTQPNCSSAKGSITITTTAATYSYDNGLTYVFSNTKTDLSPGIYFIKIKNLAGCVSEAATVTISTLSALPAPAYKASQPDCTNLTGSLSIDTVADLYSFNNGITFGTSNTKSNVAPGTYNLMIKYNSGCISLSAPITIDAAPAIPAAPQVVVTNPIGCTSSAGSIMVSTVANLYSFDDGVTWNTTNTASLSPGNYLIRIKYTNGCPSIAYAATINAPPNAPSTPILNVSQPVSCSNPFGSISITSAAYQYSFDNGVNYSTNPISGNIAAGTYLVRVKNSTGCESVALSIKINPPTDYPVNPAFTTIQPDCNNLKGTITITDIDAEYSLDNGVTWKTNTIQSNLDPGTYYIKVKNNIGCISNATTVTLIPFTNFTPKPTLTNPQIFCIQQNATLSSIAMTGQNIKWYDSLTNGIPLSNTTPLQNGTTYYASQTINGCESERIPVLINIQNTPPPTGNVSQTFCSSQNPTLETIEISSNEIKWYNSDGVILSNSTSLQDGVTYYASQTENSCESINKLAITVSLINTLPANNYEELFCDDLNDGTEIMNLSVYDSKLISNTLGYNFSYYSTFLGAENQLAGIQITNFSNYNLALGDNKIYVRINSSNPCYAIVELKLTVVPKPIISIPDVVPICENNSIIVDAGSGFDTYLWSTGATTSSIIVANPGNYSVTVTTNYSTISCSSTKNFQVRKSNIATITSVETQDWTDNQNMITVFASGAGDFEYSIDGIYFQDSNQFSALFSGAYTIHVRDKNGCGTVTDEVFLLMYPKYFTPNGDGFNDTWNIKFSDAESNLTVKIFDRYGKLIKELNQNGPWNGTMNGRELPSDDYWFVATRTDGKEYKGHFSLKR
jgi:gliding motility-associated-like protein